MRSVARAVTLRGCGLARMKSKHSGRRKSSRTQISSSTTWGLVLPKAAKAASPQEWRTEPLWGLRFVNFRQIGYMHDGRAIDRGGDRHDALEAAIQAHGGEGAGARDAFAALSDSEKTELLNFLETL